MPNTMKNLENKPVNDKWYDDVFKKAVETPGGPINFVKHLKCLSQFCVGSVLDLGCGLGLLADMVEGSYLGIDYSEYAIGYARKTTKNIKANFMRADLMEFIKSPILFDTIVLSEVLEHIDFPAQLIRYAVDNYQKRLVASVPINMPIKSHLKPVWLKEEILNLFGNNPIYLEQGCRNLKGKNIHWHFVYERKVEC